MTQVRYRTAREVKRAWWAKALMQSKKERSETGMTVADWCARYNVSEKSYWYYHKLLGDDLALSFSDEISETLVPMPTRGAPAAVPEFSLLEKPTATGSAEVSSSIRLQAGNISIEIPEDISDDFLIRIMKAVSHV